MDRQRERGGGAQGDKSDDQAPIARVQWRVRRGRGQGEVQQRESDGSQDSESLGGDQPSWRGPTVRDRWSVSGPEIERALPGSRVRGEVAAGEGRAESNP